MPRRKSASADQLLDAPVLALPAPRPAHRHGHDIDPYESPPGAMPPVTLSEKPITRPQTQTDAANRRIAKLEAKARAQRYGNYLEEMAHNGGDQAQALALVYNIKVEEAQARLAELHADVRYNLGSTTLTDALERNDLTLASRVHLLRKHAFSPLPAASLKALDMIQELEGHRTDAGSFEAFLRLAKARKGA